MKRVALIVVIVLFSLYFLSYIWLRQTHAEIWAKDERVYVIFPENKILYYIFRPLSYVDGQLTGIGFHIGRHR